MFILRHMAELPVNGLTRLHCKQRYSETHIHIYGEEGGREGGRGRGRGAGREGGKEREGGRREGGREGREGGEGEGVGLYLICISCKL
jgi:hypothetical protein